MKTQLKRQLKRVIPVTTCTSILLTSYALSQEVISSKSEPVKKETPIQKKAVKKNKTIIDPAVTTINKEILNPVRFQETRTRTYAFSSAFSRSGPPRPKNYELVEVSSNKKEGARYFDILVSFKTETWTYKDATGKLVTLQNKSLEKPKIYLKLKYLTATNKVLIQQNHEWVERSKHKYLSLIPVTKKHEYLNPIPVTKK